MLKLNIKKPTSGENEEEEEFVKYGAVDEFYDLEDEIGRYVSPIYLSIYLFIYLFVYLSIYLFIYLSIYLSI